MFFITNCFLKNNSKKFESLIIYNMNYNDFPILSNEEYSLISQHFSQKKFDRKTTLFQINKHLITCKTSHINNIDKLNKKTVQALNNSYNLIEKTLKNLNSLFDFPPRPNSNIKSISIFDHIEQLLSVIENLTKWSKDETKEYYKSFIQSSSLELIGGLRHLLKALSESNIFFFKHM